MGLLLVPVILAAVVAVMAATMRSLTAGLAAGLAVVAVLGLAGGVDSLAAAGAGAVAGSGLVLGFAGRGRLAGGRALVLAALPLAAVFAASVFASGRPALEQELERWAGREAGAALAPELRAEMADWVLGLVPAGAGLVSFGLVWLAYAVAVRILPRLGLEVEHLGPLAAFALPFAVIWSFAAALALCAIGQGAGERWLLLAGLNLVLVHGVAFFAQGLAVGRELLTQRAVPGGMQLLLVLMAVAMMPVTLAVAVVGLFDHWFDFRRLLAQDSGGADEGGS